MATTLVLNCSWTYMSVIRREIHMTIIRPGEEGNGICSFISSLHKESALAHPCSCAGLRLGWMTGWSPVQCEASLISPAVGCGGTAVCRMDLSMVKSCSGDSLVHSPERVMECRYLSLGFKLWIVF